MFLNSEEGLSRHLQLKGGGHGNHDKQAISPVASGPPQPWLTNRPYTDGAP